MPEGRLLGPFVLAAGLLSGIVFLTSGCQRDGKARSGNASTGSTATEPATLLGGGKSSDPFRIFGKLSTLDRNGKPGELKLAPDKVERSYIEGGTLCAAVWTFKDIDEERLRRAALDKPAHSTGTTIELAAKVIRPPYRPPPRGTVMGVWLRNPKTQKRVELPVVRGTFVDDGRALVKALAIPRRIGGPADDADFFRDFVADGTLEVVVYCLDPEVFLGMGQRDLCLSTGRAGRHAGYRLTRASRKPLAAKKDPATAYARAIAACGGVWKEYEAAIFEFTADDAKRRGILVEDEVRIADRLQATLEQCLADMRPELQGEDDGAPWFQAGIIHCLMGQEAEALDCFAKAAKSDKKHGAVYQFYLAKQAYEDADLLKAHEALTESIRLDPKNAFVYALRASVTEMLDMSSAAKDKAKSRQLDPNVDSPRRTLPWRTVHPLDESLRELGKQIPDESGSEP